MKNQNRLNSLHAQNQRFQQIYEDQCEYDDDRLPEEEDNYQRKKNVSINKVQRQNQRKNYKIYTLIVIFFIVLTIFCYFKIKNSSKNMDKQLQQSIDKNQDEDINRSFEKKDQQKKTSKKQQIENKQNDIKITVQNGLVSQKVVEKTQIKETITKQINKNVQQKNVKEEKKEQIAQVQSIQLQKKYVYGDSIDFTKIKKRNRGLPRTNLSPDNLDKAAQFYNLLGKDVENDPALKQIADMEIRYYDQKYQITQFQEQIQICVFILSYNNEPQNRYKANLDSVFQQNYENYFVVYVNDVSSDRTGELVQQYMDQHPIAKQKMTLVNNQIRKRKSRNQYELAHQYCKPGAIMFPFDGDDCIIGRQAFKLLNAIYQKKQALFVYLNFLQFHKQNPQNFQLLSGYSREVYPINKKNRDYRKDGVPLHMRTWISDIFLSVSEKDYKMDGQFVNVGEDVMIMYSLQEQAHEKAFYIPQIVYAYNQDTGVNDSSDKASLEQRKKVQQYAKKQKKLQIYDKKVQYRLKMPSKPFKLPELKK